jgi:hypothetical protein
MTFLVRRCGGTLRQTFSGIIFLTMNVDVKGEEPVRQTACTTMIRFLAFESGMLAPCPAQKYLLAQDFYFSRELC